MAQQGPTAARCTRRVFEIVAGAMPALLVALIASFMFSFPNQMLDIYRDIAQSIALGSTDTAGGIGTRLGVWRELIQSAVAVVVLSVCLWLAALVLVEGRVARDADLCRPAAAARRIAPVVIAVAPLVMLAVGLLSARVSASTATEIGRALKETFYLFSLEHGVTQEIAEIYANDFSTRLVGSNAKLSYYAGGTALLVVVLFAAFILLQRRAGLLALVRARLDLRLVPSILYALVVAGAAVALSLLIADRPVLVAEMLQPIATFSLFCVVLLLAMDVIRRFSDMTGVPLLAVVVVLALVFSLAEVNDNHAVRYEEAAAAPSARPLPRATDEFSAWLSKREDRGEFAGGRSYPVYIVAAQGGGIYAAYHSASFLADMQRLCPNFAHHLFAISGVSGGSVGAGVFNAIMREAETQKQVKIPQTGCNASAENTGPLYTEAVHAVLSKDLWSPLQAALLFPDFLQRFLFHPVAKFDRALALERGLEQAWHGMINKQNFFNPELKTVSHNLLADAYSRHWDTATFKNVPALVFNTTEVGTGHRRLIAPFQFPGTGTLNFFPLQASSQVGTPGHLPLSTAAVLSARFPWVTPLGWISGVQAAEKDEDNAKMRLVDGGYFENSGVATALDLIKELTRASSLDINIEINLIILTSAEFSPERWLGSGETLGPIQTMLNTRTARGLIEIERAKQELRTMSTDRMRFRTVEVKLLGYGYPLPLGWRLSTATRYLIDWQWGVRSRCTRPPEKGAAAGDVNCVKELLFRQLSRPSPP